MPLLATAAVQLPPERRAQKTGPRRAASRLSPLSQALDLKSQAYADALAKRTPVHIRAALMRAWVDLQEITMALRGQGKPKPVEARNATSKRKPSSAAPVVYPSPGEASAPAVMHETTRETTRAKLNK